MKKTVAPILLGAFFATAASAFAADRPSVTHYSLRVQLFLKEQRLEANTEMTVRNTTQTPHQEIPFLLYRLLEVASVEDANGKPLQFTQAVARDADERNLQVNYVRLRLPQPLRRGASTTVRMKYGGSVYGYSEVWRYVRDTVNEDYTLLREDSLFYPVLARPSREGRAGILDRKFAYDVEVTVPSGYVVAAGGLRKETREEGPQTRFLYASRVPTWRIDVAAAKFAQLRDAENELTVYVLPEHVEGGRNVLEAMKRAVALYSRWFGPPRYRGYTAIEIPDGWGSQAAEFYFLQTAAAFTKPERMGEVYHEIAHTWSPKAKAEVQRCRWFDEAFASYFESLALREFQGQQAFAEDMENARRVFLKWVEADQRHADTPIVDYGKHEMGGLSYTKGAWALYVLHQLLGEEAFLHLVRQLLAEYGERGANFRDFQELAERVAQRPLQPYFREWLNGSESSRLLIEGAPIEKIVARYK